MRPCPQCPPHPHPPFHHCSITDLQSRQGRKLRVSQLWGAQRAEKSSGAGGGQGEDEGRDSCPSPTHLCLPAPTPIPWTAPGPEGRRGVGGTWGGWPWLGRGGWGWGRGEDSYKHSLKRPKLISMDTVPVTRSPLPPFREPAFRPEVRLPWVFHEVTVRWTPNVVSKSPGQPQTFLIGPTGYMHQGLRVTALHPMADDPAERGGREGALEPQTPSTRAELPRAASAGHKGCCRGG